MSLKNNQKKLNLGMQKILKMSTEERRKNGKKAAITARSKRTTKEIIQIMLDSTISDIQRRKEIESYGIMGIRRAELIDNIIKKASKSANMAELLFKLSGDLNTEKAPVNITIVNSLTDEQLENERLKLINQSQQLIDVTPKPPCINGNNNYRQ